MGRRSPSGSRLADAESGATLRSAGPAELPPAARDTLITHRHDPIEAYYVIEGEGVVSIDGVDHPVRAGSAVFRPGACEPAALNTGSTVMRLLYVFASDSFDDVDSRFSTSGSQA